MSRFFATALLLPLAGALLGCGHGLTLYQPKLVAQGELLLSYDNHFTIFTADRPVAEGIRYTGLADHVRCVPNAHRHAQEAESDGAAGYGLSIAGGATAVVGLGGLSGLAFYSDKSQQTMMAALLGGGIALELLGLAMAIVGRGYKASANGHAVDAVNYYNDAVGSVGGSCDRPVAPSAPVGKPEGAPAGTAVPPALAPRVE